MQYNPHGNNHPLGDAVGITPTNVSVTNVSGTILLFNTDRRYVFLSNTGIQDAYLAVGQTAIAGSGLLLAKGEVITLSSESTSMKLGINGITSVGSTTIAILEIE